MTEQTAMTDTTADARLPASYEAARTAIAACERIDECKTWSDKAAAVKAYAVMRDDRTLHNHALRIQLRAERRLGELLKQIEPAKGGDRGNAATGGHPPVAETRTQAATHAGLSEHQRKTALRVAAVPDAEFNRQVESEKPPTITRLADQGRVSRTPMAEAPLPAKEPASSACDMLEAFVGACAVVDPVAAARLSPAELVRVRQAVMKIDNWLDRFMNALPA